MQRPFIFLATPDPEFERLAIDAILATHRGVRRVHSLEAACDSLAGGTRNLALAVVDITHHGFGEELLAVLGGLKADFPVLAITDATSAPGGIMWDGFALATLDKADAANALENRLRDLCTAKVLCAA